MRLWEKDDNPFDDYREAEVAVIVVATAILVFGLAAVAVVLLV